MGRCRMSDKTILIADDNNFIRRLVSVALQPLGCNLIEAVDGEEAITIIAEQSPDIVLLDLVMPKLNGFEVLEWIRKRPETSDLTVVMLTAAGSEVDLKQGKQHNVAAYIVKPFNNTDLKETVAELLQH